MTPDTLVEYYYALQVFPSSFFGTSHSKIFLRALKHFPQYHASSPDTQTSKYPPAKPFLSYKDPQSGQWTLTLWESTPPTHPEWDKIVKILKIPESQVTENLSDFNILKSTYFSDLKQVSFTSQQAIDQFYKKYPSLNHKKNEKSRQADDSLKLEEPIQDLIYARGVWNRATTEGLGGTFVAIDIEAWERDTKLITEVGMSLLHIEPGTKYETRIDRHFILEENVDKRNGRWIEDNRDNFAFGTSEILPTSRAVSEIHRHVLSGIRVHNGVSVPPIFIVHDHISERVLLRRLGYPEWDLISSKDQLFAEKNASVKPADGVLMDTQRLFAAWEQESLRHCRVSLEKVCKVVGVMTKVLHNAGNDAHFTLDAFVKFANSTGFDTQPKELWKPLPKRANPKGTSSKTVTSGTSFATPHVGSDIQTHVALGQKENVSQEGNDLMRSAADTESPRETGDSLAPSPSQTLHRGEGKSRGRGRRRAYNGRAGRGRSRQSYGE